jgi:hypothetical protein
VFAKKKYCTSISLFMQITRSQLLFSSRRFLNKLFVPPTVASWTIYKVQPSRYGGGSRRSVEGLAGGVECLRRAHRWEVTSAILVRQVVTARCAERALLDGHGVGAVGLAQLPAGVTKPPLPFFLACIALVWWFLAPACGRAAVALPATYYLPLSSSNTLTPPLFYQPPSSPWPNGAPARIRLCLLATSLEILICKTQVSLSRFGCPSLPSDPSARTSWNGQKWSLQRRWAASP